MWVVEICLKYVKSKDLKIMSKARMPHECEHPWNPCILECELDGTSHIVAAYCFLHSTFQKHCRKSSRKSRNTSNCPRRKKKNIKHHPTISPLRPLGIGGWNGWNSAWPTNRCLQAMNFRHVQSFGVVQEDQIHRPWELRPEKISKNTEPRNIRHRNMKHKLISN